MKLIIKLFFIFTLQFSQSAYSKDFILTCKERIQSILTVNPLSTTNLRLSRTKLLKRALAKGDVEKVILILKKTHDNNSQSFKAGQLLKGRNAKKEKKLIQMRERTGSLYVPAYHQNNEGDAEIFSTIVNVTNGKNILSEDEADAIVDVQSWIKEYESYWEKMQDAVNYATESGFVSAHIKGKYFKKVNPLQESDFPLEIPLPYIDKEGSIDWENIEFGSLTRLESYMTEKRRVKDMTFATGAVDNYLRKSKIYDIMYQQGLNYRRLELVYIRLREMGERKLDDKQVILLKRIKELLSTKPELRPRSDVVKILQTREYKAERRAVWRFWRSKRIKTKYTIPDSVLNQVQSVSPQGMITKYLGVTAAVTAVGSFAASFALPLEEIPAYQYFLASIDNYYNDMILSITGTSKNLLACGKSADREFHMKNGSVTKNLLEAHLSRHRIYSRFNDDYDHNLDIKVQKREQELRVMCIKTRNNYRQAEAHFTNKEELALSYRMAVDSFFIDIIQAQHPKSEAIVPLLEKLFGLRHGEAAKDKEQIVIDQIGLFDPDLKELLPKYLEDMPKGAETLDKVGSLPKYKSIPEFIESLSKRYEPAKTKL